MTIRAVPFVEHLQSKKISIIKTQKKIYQMIISHMACFCRAGVKFEQCNINIFCHLNNGSTLKTNLTISFSRTLHDLHTLDKFSALLLEATVRR